MIKSRRMMLLAGVSAVAMLASAPDASAETFTFTGGVQNFTAPVSGDYSLVAFSGSGGNGLNGGGGMGSRVIGDIFLTAGEDLTLFVGGQGQNSPANAGGGGGGTFVFLGTTLLAVAGGGGGGATQDGGGGLSGTSGGAGGGLGGVGGANGSGGGGGVDLDGGNGGGGAGAGANSGSAGYGGDGLGVNSGSGGKFPNGGAGFSGGGFGDGGFGGGGGGAFGGGGGGGFSGGGGGGFADGVAGGGGGGSYLSSLFTNQYLTPGFGDGNGLIDINFFRAVPEPSTWGMTLAGFAGLGWLAHLRRRKTSTA
jgi:hypothetical protein